MPRPPGPYTKHAPQVNVRLEPELDAALEQLAEGNGLPRAETARLLIRAGIRSVADSAGRSLTPPPPPLTRAQLADRAAFLVEQLAALLELAEKVDGPGALGLARAAERSLREWCEDRSRHVPLKAESAS